MRLTERNQQKLELADVLNIMIETERGKLLYNVKRYKMNARHWKNVYDLSIKEPLPGANYLKMTQKLKREREQIVRNIRYLSYSIISAKEQLKELKPNV